MMSQSETQTDGASSNKCDPDNYASFYVHMIPDLKKAAHQKGYALGIHGSLREDLDMIAVPWVQDASSEEALIASLLVVVKGFVDPETYKATKDTVVSNEMKPHNRRAWTLGWGGRARVDLSVMPKAIDHIPDTGKKVGHSVEVNGMVAMLLEPIDRSFRKFEDVYNEEREQAADLLARTEARRVESTEAIRKLTAIVSDLGQKNAELEEVVEKCTKVTADGKRVGWGDKIYPPHPVPLGDPENPDDPSSDVPDHAMLKCFICDFWSGEKYDIEYEGMSVESCYSTPQAALAAREQNGGSDE